MNKVIRNLDSAITAMKWTIAALVIVVVLEVVALIGFVLERP